MMINEKWEFFLKENEYDMNFFWLIKMRFYLNYLIVVKLMVVCSLMMGKLWMFFKCMELVF